MLILAWCMALGLRGKFRRFGEEASKSKEAEGGGGRVGEGSLCVSLRRHILYSNHTGRDA